VYSARVLNSAAMTCNNFHQLETDVTFKDSCIISACDVKYDGNCISGLAFVRGTLFDPAIGGLSGCYPIDQGIIPFEVRWSPPKWTRVLRPCAICCIIDGLCMDPFNVQC
jgi:hypothetical protein